jgi:hypothetical protein
MEAVRYSETSVNYQITQSHISENSAFILAVISPIFPGKLAYDSLRLRFYGKRGPWKSVGRCVHSEADVMASVSRNQQSLNSLTVTVSCLDNEWDNFL